jgi:hypothetical protein
MICEWNKVRCIDMEEYEYEDKDNLTLSLV